MREKYNLPDILLEVIPVLLAFFVPTFFLPTTMEFFEFNKLALIVASSAVMLIAWGVKMLIAKSVRVTKSGLDIAFVALLTVYILSTIFSLDKTSSLFGSQGRWFPGLGAILVLIAFYYTTSSNIMSTKVIRNAVYSFLAGSTLSTAVALLSYYKIYIGEADYFRIPNFTLTGSSTVSAILAALAAVIVISLIINSSRAVTTAFLLPILIINSYAVLLVGDAASWAALAFGAAAVFYFTPLRQTMQNRFSTISLISISAISAVMIAAFVVPVSRDLLVDKNYPRELKLSPRDSWRVVSSAMRDYPVLGAGPSTFYLIFPSYRPMSLNTGDLWNVRYDKAYSEALSVVGSLGVAGIVIAAFFVVRVIKHVLSSKSMSSRAIARDLSPSARDDALFDSEAAAILSAVIIGLLVSFFFTYATVTTAFLSVLFLALLTSLMALEPDSKFAETVGLSLSSSGFKSASIVESIGGVDSASVGAKSEVFQYVAVVPIFIFVGAVSYFSYVTYAAEYYMRKSVIAALQNDGAKTYEWQGKAVNVNPRRFAYHNAYAQTNLNLAGVISANESLSDEDRNTIQVLISQAIRSIRASTEVIAPLHAGSWEVRGGIYRALMGAAQDADQWAIGAYNTAVNLDPGNPRIRVDLGGIYFAKEDYLSAANMFRQAVNLKGDYANARYNFAHSLLKLELYADAQREFETTKGLVAMASEDYKKVVADIEALKALPAVAGIATSEKPSVADLEGAGATAAEKEKVSRQEPLTQPSEAVKEGVEGTPSIGGP